MSKVIGILTIVMIAFYWSHTQKLKTLALRAGKKRCDEAGVQLLDHSVVQNKLAFAKDSSGRWRLHREYLFDFTSTGEQRYSGRVIMQGFLVVTTELEPFTIN